MTIKPGDFAIWAGGYRPVVVTITTVTDKTVRFKEGEYRERRGDKSQVAAYGTDRHRLELAVQRMISASSEANSRRSAASIFERKEHARIAKECMA